MAISTNSIIHYTDSFKVLTSILSEGFRIKYCVEKLILSTGTSKAAHPMISFCDIPLSDSSQHFKAYGRYGIGLSKDWAIKNGINPVLYIDKDSLIAKSLYGLLKERRSATTNLTPKQDIELLQIKSYAKNYSGLLERKLVNDPNYKFYDEREWRLVPNREELNDQPFSIHLSTYMKDKDGWNSKLSGCRFGFTAKDISYIIVDQTSEIPDMIHFLRADYSDKCTARDLDILFSKICSTQQIVADY